MEGGNGDMCGKVGWFDGSKTDGNQDIGIGCMELARLNCQRSEICLQVWKIFVSRQLQLFRLRRRCRGSLAGSHTPYIAITREQSQRQHDQRTKTSMISYSGGFFVLQLDRVSPREKALLPVRVTSDLVRFSSS